MKRKHFTYLIFSLIAASLLFVNCKKTGFGHGFGGNDQEHFEYMIWRLDKELDFTDGQKDLINKIQKEVKEKHKEMKADCNHDEKMEKIKELIKSDNLNEHDILTIIDEKQEKLESMKQFIAEKIVEIQRTLTPEQKDKIIKLIGKFAKMPKKCGMGMCHGIKM